MVDEGRRAEYEKIVSIMIAQWEKAEREKLIPTFSKNLLKDILHLDKILYQIKVLKSEFPSDFFQYIFTELKNKNLQQGFFKIIRAYIETFETVGIFANDPSSTNRFRGKYICLYSALRKGETVSIPFKELLITVYLEERYFLHGKHRFILKMAGKVLSILRDERYKERVQYIQLLALKRLLKYEELQRFFHSAAFPENKPINLMRKASIHYTLGEMNEAVALYEKAAQQQTNVKVAACAIYTLKQLKRNTSSIDSLYKRIEAINIKELEFRFNQFTKNIQAPISITYAETILTKYERKAFDNIVERERVLRKREENPSFGFDSYLQDAFLSFVELIGFIEKWGLPDLFVTANRSSQDVFQRLLYEEAYRDVFQFIVFGFPLKDFSMSDEKLMNLDSDIFKELISHIQNLITLLQSNSYSDYTRIQMVNVLNLLLELWKAFLPIMNDTYLSEIVDALFSILKLKIPAINNSVHPLSHEILVELMNSLLSEEQIRLFNRYFSYVIESGFDRYEKLTSISFKEGGKELAFFQYDLFVKAALLMKEKSIINYSHIFNTMLNVHYVSPIPQQEAEQLVSILLRIEGRLNDHNRMSLIRLLATLDIEEAKEYVARSMGPIITFYVQDMSMSTALGQPLFILAEILPLLSNEQMIQLTWKARKDLKGIKSFSTEEHFSEVILSSFEQAYLYWFMKLSLHKEKPYFFKHALGAVRSKSLYSASMDILRKARSISPYFSLPIELEEYKQKLVDGNRDSRISIFVFLRKWLRAGEELTEQDKEFLGVLAYMFWDSSYEVRGWVLSIYTEAGSKDQQWVLPYLDNMFLQAKQIIKSRPSIQLLVAATYFFTTFRDPFIESQQFSEQYSELIGILHEVPYRKVKNELLLED